MIMKKKQLKLTIKKVLLSVFLLTSLTKQKHICHHEKKQSKISITNIKNEKKYSKRSLQTISEHNIRIKLDFSSKNLNFILTIFQNQTHL